MVAKTVAESVRRHVRRLQPGTLFTPSELVREHLGTDQVVREALRRSDEQALGGRALMKVFCASAIALAIALIFPLSVFAAPSAPASVIHALKLQTVGVLAQMAVVEPCTTAGMADAVKRNETAVENQDAITLSTEQRGFTTGFARCALSSTAAEDFATFSAACIQSGLATIAADRALGGIEPTDRAKAHQFAVIAKFIVSDASASSVDKSIARDTLKRLRKMHLI